MSIHRLLGTLPATRADDLPSDAVKRVKHFETEAEAIRKKADDEINAQHDKLLADLENLKKEYTESGDLDAALAIREHIRQLKKSNEKAGPAEPDPKNKLAGEWLMEGREDEPCAIFQQGRVLLLVNERGEFATARMTEAKNFTTKGWEDGLVGELVKEGKEIAWSNGTTWKRP